MASDANSEHTSISWSFVAKAYVAIVSLCGLSILAHATLRWDSRATGPFLAYLFMAGLASAMKVSLPAVTGTMSVSFIFILLGIVDCSLSQTLLIGVVATLVQVLWHAKTKPSKVQVLFNVASITIAMTVTHAVFRFASQHAAQRAEPLLLALAATTFFVTNTLSVAGVIAVTEGKHVLKVWRGCFLWSFPHYLVGASIAAVVSALNHIFGWQISVLVVPVIYLVFRSFRLYLGRLEEEKKHAEELAALHLRTIEGLALAIDAKDSATHDHLQRVQVYAESAGRALGLSEPEMEALRTASILHDVGKLAVPEHIISKPGRLTPEEFEKMKIHPVVGAEILERIQFPYPVAPIVRSHHERWNGAGYPDGLKGEEIPIGARVLAVVDCLDALASDRQYRRALPLDEAIQKIADEAGTSFDPKVVQVVRSNYVEWEKRAKSLTPNMQPLPTAIKIENGTAPAAGFEVSAAPFSSKPTQFLTSIAGARQEAQALYEIAQDLGSSLGLTETLSVIAVRLKRLVVYDTIAIYLCRQGKLEAEFVSGENARLFGSLEIPIGHGLSGWVAENRKPILNGNPSVEPGYLNDPQKFSTLGSALGIPLEGPGGVVGVLTLYRMQRDGFTQDDLRLLQAISLKLALCVENAIKFRRAESSATLDPLTGLPNTRALFLHLDSELARSKRYWQPLAVLVCDLGNFKSINDCHGQLQGNKVLQEAARVLKDNCREYDYVSRMGGDEFVIVSPNLEPEDLPAAVERISKAITEAGQRMGLGAPLALRVGEARYPADGGDAEALLAKADLRLYEAKQRSSSPREDLLAMQAALDSEQIPQPQ